jgi:V/A-type H+-transporting ATPase subunit C
MKSSDYTFLTGKIRYLETKLPDFTDLERMLDAPDLDSAFKAFYDTDYAEFLPEKKPEEFEKVILEDLLESKRLLFQFVPDEDLIKFLLLEYDFHNLKVIFKEKLFDVNLDHLLIPLGFFDPEIFKKIILEEKKTKIDKDFEEIIEEAKKFLNKFLPFYLIEFFFDKKYFFLYKKIAERLKNKFLIDFVNFKIDLTNLRIFLRVKEMNKDIDFLKEALVGSGKIKENDFLKFFFNLENGFKYFAKFLPIQFEKYFQEFLKEKNLKLFEKRCFEEEIRYLRKAKYIAFGPEVVVAYFYAKENANKNVRLIMTGKLNKIEREILKERLRELY